MREVISINGKELPLNFFFLRKKKICRLPQRVFASLLDRPPFELRKC